MFKTIKIRKETDGSLIYDVNTRKYVFSQFDFFGKPLTINQIREQVCQELKMGEMDESDILSLVFLDNQQLYSNNLSAPIGIYFEIAESCNLDCEHCYKASLSKKVPLNLKEMKKTIDELASLGVLEFRFCGNEPVVHKYFSQLAFYAKSKGFYLSTNTNGFYDDSYINKLIEIGFNEVIISIEGQEETHDEIRGSGSYKKALNVLRALKEHGVKSRINMTVSKFNLKELEFIGDLAVKHGAYVSYIPIRVVGKHTAYKKNFGDLTDQDMLEIVKRVEYIREKYPKTRFLTYFDILSKEPDYYHPLWFNNPCPARKNLFISYAGDVYPCDYLIYLGDVFFGGNIRKKTIADIWHHAPGIRRFRELKHTQKCQKCNFLSTKCYGGCPSEALAKKLIVDDHLCFKDRLNKQ